MRAYRVAYDGQPYYGFQRQPDVSTVEDELLRALEQLDVTDGETPPGYAAAGRTDAGVSAIAQTIAFEAPEWLSPAAFNSELPAAIRVWASTPTPAEFHATHDATARTYIYYLHAPDIDDDRVQTALSTLEGTHDFHNFTPDDAGTERTLSTTWTRDGPMLVIELEAGGFPRQFVRRVVSLVADVGYEAVPMERVDRALGSDPLDGPQGIGPAPAGGLVLTDVEYPQLSFAVDETAAASAREYYESLHAERATATQVAGRLIRFEE